MRLAQSGHVNRREGFAVRLLPAHHIEPRFDGASDLSFVFRKKMSGTWSTKVDPCTLDRSCRTEVKRLLGVLIDPGLSAITVRGFVEVVLAFAG
jgi:hypothetical protein